MTAVGVVGGTGPARSALVTELADLGMPVNCGFRST